MDLIFMTCKVNDFRLSFVLISDDLYILFCFCFLSKISKKTIQKWRQPACGTAEIILKPMLL